MNELETMSFEEAMQKLTEAAQQLRSGQLSLEESIEVYDKSILYYNLCSEKLAGIKQKIEMYDPQKGTTEDFDL